MKRFLSIGLAATMLFNAGIPVLAEEVSSAGNSSTSPVTISADAAAFNVTIPLSLPAHVNSIGMVTTADDTQIINKSSSQVKISAVAFEAQGDWTLAEYGADLSGVKVGTKTVGINIAGAVDEYANINLDNGIYTDADGAAVGDAASAFTVIPGATFDNNGNTEGTAMMLKYNATIPAQKDSISDDASETAANVIFTIEWDDGATTNIVPDGATYYVGVTNTALGYYTGATATYSAGEEMPTTVSDGDVLVYKDYEYRYNYYHDSHKWYKSTNQNGWGVKVTDTAKEEYDEIFTEINGLNVTNMYATFNSCSLLTESPIIPDNVTNMNATFNGCKALTKTPRIPDGVTTMNYTFYNCTALTQTSKIPANVTQMNYAFSNCTALTGTIEVDANPTKYAGFLSDTGVTEIIGATTMAAELLATK